MPGGFGFESSASSEGLARGSIGPWQLVRLLGQGGMGVVYEARDASGRRAALKLLRQGATPRQAQRFQREAEALRRLRHPGLPALLDAGRDDRAGPWLAMELIEGEDLAARIARALPAPSQTARIGAEVAEALAQLHARGLVHRDLKPGNVVVTHEGRAVLVDLGLSLLPDLSRMTATGAFLGTPACAAPEQLDDPHQVGPPADVWGLGITLHLALCGETPASLGGRPLQALNPAVPAALVELTLACLRARPEDRPTAAGLTAALQALARGREPPPGSLDPAPTGRAARTWPTLVIVALSLTVAGAGVALLARASRAPTPTTAPGPADQPAWSLGSGPAPALRPPAAWQEGGRLVDPLGDGALSALQGARAERLPDGRLRLAWEDPARALRPRVRKLEPAWRNGGLPALTSPAPGRVATRVDEGLDLTLSSSGRWRRPQLDLRLLVGRGDARQITLQCLPCAGAADKSSLVLDGRGQTLRGGRGTELTTLTRWEQAQGWQRLSWNPATGAVELGSQSLSAPALSEPGPVRLELSLVELELSLEALVISGELARPPTPAWGQLPVEPGERWTLRAGFELLGEGSGGPFLGLLDDAGQGITCELDGTRLVARRGERPLGQVDLEAPPRAGQLELRRDVDLLEITLQERDGSRRALRLGLCEPVPTSWRPAFGSAACLVRFSAVDFTGQAGEPLRRAFDDGRAPAGPDDPQERWRRAASRLEALTLPGAVGGDRPPNAAARAGEAAQLAGALIELEARVRPELRADALARAAWAAAHSGQRPLLEQALGRLRASCPEERLARALVDGLWQSEDGGLLAQLGTLWPQVVQGEPEQLVRVQVRTTILELLERLSDPAEQLLAEELALERSRLVARAVGVLSPEVWREECERALARLGALAEARPSNGLSSEQGALCGLLAQQEAVAGDAARARALLVESAAHWERSAEQQPGSSTRWFALFSAARAHAHLGRWVEALEVQLAACAAAPSRRDLWAELIGFLDPRHDEGSERPRLESVPGLVAAACLLVSERTRGGSPDRERLRQAARRALAAPTADPRQRDLQRWARVALEGPASWDGEWSPDRPASLLAAARCGEAAAGQLLPDAARRDRTLDALVRLDPALAKFLRE